MTDKQIIIDGLSCDNCPESKRCQEQQTKKEYAINQVLQDIPSEYANVIDRLKQIIPSITRCDYVLEKQLKRKEQEYEELRQYHNKCCEENTKKLEEWLEKYNQISRGFYNGDYCNTENCSLLKAKEQECEKLKKQHQADKCLITSTGKMNYQLIQEYDKLKNCLTEIKEIAEENIRIADLEGLNGVYRRGLAEQILQKISDYEVGNEQL